MPENLPSDHQVGYWYYGPTGCGKSHSARVDFPDPYLKASNNKWWCNYKHEENALLEDLDKDHHYMGFHLKIWADRYAFSPETKGSSLMIRPKHIIVTSNYHPKEIWNDKSTLEPILRRFKIVRFLSLSETIFQGGDEEQRAHYLTTTNTDIFEITEN